LKLTSASMMQGICVIEHRESPQHDRRACYHIRCCCCCQSEAPASLVYMRE